MTERSFSVRGTRRVLKEVLQEVRWDVYAESHEAARDLVLDGVYNDYEIEDDEYDVLDDCYETLDACYDINEILCDDCGGESEDFCECGETTDHTVHNPDADAPGVVQPVDLEPGEWVVPADDFSREYWKNLSEEPDSPVEVQDVYQMGDDVKVEFIRTDGSEDYWWVPVWFRFRYDSPDSATAERIREERERKEQEQLARIREEQARARNEAALRELVDPVPF